MDEHAPDRAPFTEVSEFNARSIRGIVRAVIDVKSWIENPPSVDQVRPACCPACAVPSRPIGSGLLLHGHGLRSRQLWGPPQPHATSEIRLFNGRRHQCQRCGAVTMVLPTEALTKRLYSAASIAWTLALFGIALLSPVEIRRLVSPQRIWGFAAARGWATIFRWAAAAAEGHLFGCVRPSPPQWPARKVAERAAATVAARATPHAYLT